MKALILYVLFVVAGVVISALVSIYVERVLSSAAGLLVFLPLFFVNFAISWIAVILVMDGSLRNAQAKEEQREIEAMARGTVGNEGNAG